MTLPYAYYAATLCKKPEKTNERILRSRTDGQMDGWQTDESEFVGPNSASGGEPKMGKKMAENIFVKTFTK